MAKLYSERLIRQDEDGLQVPGSFRLRFNKNEPFIKPHFKAILTEVPFDLINVGMEDAIEGVFSVHQENLGGEIEGFFDQDNSITEETAIVERSDYEVVIADEEQATVTPVTATATNNTVDDNKPKVLSSEELTKETDPGIKTPWAKSIKIEQGTHSGSSVPLKPVTFTVAGWGSKENEQLLAWMVFEGHSADKPILFAPNQGAEYTVDFSQLPEGKYRVEAFGKYGKWHAENGISRFGKTLSSKAKNEKYAILDIESKTNALEKLSSDDLVKNKSEEREVNWGVDVQFSAGLLFKLEEDTAQLEWKMKDAEGNVVMEETTAAAKGQPSITLNFQKPEKREIYTLEVSFNGSTKTQKFAVVEKAYVKTVAVDSSTQRLIYNEKKELTFKVTGFTQKKANAEDIKNIKWIRIFFPGLHYEDYPGDIKLTGTDGKVTAAALKNTAGEIEHFNGSEQWKAQAGIIEQDGPAKGKYKKGLYVVEAYTSKADGKGAETAYYEIARNETKEIEGRKVIRPSVAGGEKFKYSVKKWTFNEAHGEGPNVNWALYEGDKEIRKYQKGESAEVFHDTPGEYTLKAWVEDKSRAAVFQVKVEEAKIVKAFIADSSGKKITTSGFDDKVYIYMKTEGLQGEKVQVSLFDLDDLGDEFLQSADSVVSSSGVIFQEITLKKDNLLREEGEEEVEIYPVITMPADSKIILKNTFFKRERTHYYLKEETVLEAENEKVTAGYDFTGSDGMVLQKPVLYGDKVKVRVKLTNRHGEKVNIALCEYDTGLPLKALPKIVVNDEGYAEVEFTIDKDWEKKHPAKTTDARYFYPVLYNEDKSTTLIDEEKKKEPMLKVVKTMPLQEEIDKMGWEKPEYAELERVRKTGDAGDQLIWGGLVSKEFRIKVVEIAGKLQADPNHLMAIMHLETSGTFDPAIDNGIGYVGLIQFGKSAAEQVGTTQDALKKMTGVQQLDYVYEFLKGKRGKLNTFTDFYLAVLMPGDVGKGSSPNEIIFDAQATGLRKDAYFSNPAFHKEKGEYSNQEYKDSKGKTKRGFLSGKTYVWEITQEIQSHYDKGFDYAIGVNEERTLASIYAKKILDSGQVTFDKVHSEPKDKGSIKAAANDPANADDNVRDAAADLVMKTSNYSDVGETEVSLNIEFWIGFYKLSQKYKMNISEISGGDHGDNSRHYAGVAIDINQINGVQVTINNPDYKDLMKDAKSFGATEVLGPPEGGHSRHVHLGWPRPKTKK